MKPYFSVCVPNYNNEPFIARTLESLLRQNYPDFEIVIADNASTDKSLELIRAYMKKDTRKRIRLVQNPRNLGYIANCNIAVQSSQGTHFLLIGGDDVMYDGMLEEYARRIKQFEKQGDRIFISGACYYIDEADKKLNLRRVDSFASLEESDDYVRLDPANTIRHVSRNVGGEYWGDYQTQCFSRSLYDEVGGYDPSFRFNPEFEFVMQVLHLQPVTLYLKKPFIGFRCHSQSERGKLERAHLFYLLDHYRIYLNDARIKKYGLDRKKVERDFVRKSCVGPGFFFLQNGKYFTALQCLSSAFFFLPRIALQLPVTYLLLLLLALGPLAVPVAWVFGAVRSRLRPK